MQVMVRVDYVNTDGCGGDFVVAGDETQRSWHVERGADGRYLWEENDKVDPQLWARLRSALEPIVCSTTKGYGVHAGQRLELTV